MIELGKEGRDKITGFKGILVAKVEYLFGCTQWGLSGKIQEDGKVGQTEFFDEGRIEIVGNGILPEEVKTEVNGGVNRDAPKR
jgi:hypothetical protein